MTAAAELSVKSSSCRGMAVVTVWWPNIAQPNETRKRNATRWTGRAMSKAVGVRSSAVQRRFLKAVKRAVPAGKVVHAIIDNYARPQTAQRPQMDSPIIRAGRPISLRPRPRGSNAVVSFFSAITRRQIRRGTFRSADERD
jgi:hypothetical protein